MKRISTEYNSTSNHDTRKFEEGIEMNLTTTLCKSAVRDLAAALCGTDSADIDSKAFHLGMTGIYGDDILTNADENAVRAIVTKCPSCGYWYRGSNCPDCVNMDSADVADRMGRTHS